VERRALEAILAELLRELRPLAFALEALRSLWLVESRSLNYDEKSHGSAKRNQAVTVSEPVRSFCRIVSASSISSYHPPALALPPMKPARIPAMLVNTGSITWVGFDSPWGGQIET